MTIKQAIDLVDEMKPNQYSVMDKIHWLNELDGRVKTEITDTHEGGDSVPLPCYDAGKTDLDSTELLVPEPYSEVYLHYLFAKIDFNNAEFGRYNNDMTMFNNAYSDYAAYYNRRNLPLQANSITY